MAKKKTEQRDFRMHPKLLFDVIQRQAGSISKATLEGVMNAKDAGATKVEVSLSTNKLIIRDNGKGFRSREEITTFFEVFGQPHDESEGKTYGTFRMGRGQLFAFGGNVWRTGQWRMDVDIKNRGLNYDLVEGLAAHKGCEVEVSLYEPLGHVEIRDVERELADWCRYAPLQVILNGKQVSVDPETEKWDHVLPEAYIRLKDTGGIKVYNLGIFCMEIQQYRYGCGGLVVSRKQLKVNFARNDIQSDCPVWKVVKPLLNKITTERNTKRSTLDDAARERLSDQIIAGELDLTNWDNTKLKILTAATGRHYSIQDVLLNRTWSKLSSAKLGDNLADKVMKRGQAFVLAEITLERFNCSTVEELLDIFKKRLHKHYLEHLPEPATIEELTADLDTKYVLLEPGELTVTEKLWLRIAETSGQYIRVNDETCFGYFADRQLFIGDGPADGWTDGSSYVAIGREFLSTLNFDAAGFVKLGNLLLHEACHDTADTLEHAHDQAFFETFHDNIDSVAAFADHVLKMFPRTAEYEGRKMTKKQLATQDKQIKAEQAAETFKQMAARHEGGSQH